MVYLLLVLHCAQDLAKKLLPGACGIACGAPPGQVDPLWDMLPHGAGPSPSSMRLLGLPVNMWAKVQEGGEAWAWQSHASAASYWPKHV